jgi:hypothetical protein
MPGTLESLLGHNPSRLGVEVEVRFRLGGSRFATRVDVSAPGPFSAFHVVAGVASQDPIGPHVNPLGILALRAKVIDFALAFTLAVSTQAEEHRAEVRVEITPLTIGRLLPFLV